MSGCKLILLVLLRAVALLYNSTKQEVELVASKTCGIMQKLDTMIVADIIQVVIKFKVTYRSINLYLH